ncbi:hypothetical protein IQ235_08125 [Oscillatoriales cyanobacterium LEGE 11467]|uniref:Uncharacterized protein n=1 Tax=Zarconia navalis LEGE 11467 TaxID=1828826 RepID=A0A928VUT8_9CYAN|nr:hypothetical protein [Zarconia navalis]MBE9040744.1 hypothetical protein [Zarconia navalis LEGE 11467]
MKTGRKEEFDNWFESALDYLKGQYINLDLWLSTESLETKHWHRLWRIFENCIEQNHQGAKEYLIDF